ncbi:ATP-dependent RNA helicase DDX19A [Lamellibrachia satsuma]|nr:ATP-dependent RNA helicase DDX19A [Lamellibrachia satsuma]
MADDEWARSVDEQEKNKLSKEVENIKISDGVPANRTPAARVEDTKCEPVASPAKVAPPTAANASGDASHDTSGWEEDEVEASSKADASLINKLLRSKLVTSTRDLEVLQRDPNSPLFSVKSFEALHLKPELLKGVYDMGFNAPSKIQETALPALLADPPQNMIAQSQSGTGKTAAFVLTMLSRVDSDHPHTQVSLYNYAHNMYSSHPHTQCLCLAPTYELALQIGQVCEQMAKHMPDTKIAYAVRGQRRARGERLDAHIVIGTPGTMLDWCTKLRIIDLKNVRVFVLDEADVMIDTQGHQDQSIRIQRGLSKNCQMLLFSATYDGKVMKFAQAVVPNPVLIRLRREEETLANIKQYYIDCKSQHEKFQALSNIYGAISIGQSMIFCHSKKTASSLSEKMTEEGHAVALLSGELEVGQRAAVIQRFREGKEKVLITTNVSARGIDVEQVTVVVNFDLPLDHNTRRADCETYLHRIGRTGRFGKNGLAINMVDGPRTMAMLKEIESHFGIKVMRLDADDFDEIERIGNA